MLIPALFLAVPMFQSPVPVPPEPPPAVQVAVPRQATASLQLAHAKTVRAAARGASGAARVEALQEAATAYQAVTDHFPGHGVVQAEAAFRRGEIQRALGRTGLARAAFLEAYDAGNGTDYAARGLIEVGHLHRRAAEFDQALAHYRKVREIPGVLLRYSNDSLEWECKALLRVGAFEEAGRVAALWSANAEGPLDVVRAADLEIQALVGMDALDRAEARLAQVQAQLEPFVQEPSKEAEQLRKALERMKAPELLHERRSRQGVGQQVLAR
ncbi:MAG TPA: hypothetical protein VGC54_01395 [Planctomycetota bacterium]